MYLYLYLYLANSQVPVPVPRYYRLYLTPTLICICVYVCAYIYIYKYMHELCTLARWGRVSEPRHRHTTASVKGVFHRFMSYYLFRSLYILCTSCRILAYWLMFLVLHTTRNKAYLILSYLILSYLKYPAPYGRYVCSRILHARVCAGSRRKCLRLPFACASPLYSASCVWVKV